MWNDPSAAAAACIAALREGRAGEAAPLVGAARERLRQGGEGAGAAETFLRRVAAAHVMALQKSSAPLVPGAWTAGLGPVAFPALCDFLAHGAVENEAMEWACTELRAALAEFRGPRGAEWLDLACALAIQAFRMDYVLPETAGEAARADALAGGSRAAESLALLALYRPLHRLPQAVSLVASLQPSPGAYLAELLRVQVTEPLRERELAASIRSLTPIADATSREVQAQYEDNPYPRWHRLPGRQGPSGEPDEGPPEGSLLVAGCGTGRQALSAALASPRKRVLAVDLSRASLAYAQRKATELGVRNLDFAHADLLALPATGLRFDAITSTGVIHHLREPGKGLQALRALMAHDTGLKLAVYTESGRRGVVAAIRLREEYALPATPEGIREFRQIVAALPDDDPAREIMGYADFYSMPGVRDLVFHVMEHRYTLPSFAALVDASGLRIRQLLAPQELRERFVARFPQAGAAGNFEAWDQFERENPGCFGSMYRFLLAKA